MTFVWSPPPYLTEEAERWAQQFGVESLWHSGNWGVHQPPYPKWPKRCFHKEDQQRARPLKRPQFSNTEKEEGSVVKTCTDCLVLSLWSKQDPHVECWFRRAKRRRRECFWGKRKRRVQNRQKGPSMGSKSTQTLDRFYSPQHYIKVLTGVLNTLASVASGNHGSQLFKLFKWCEISLM